jgi:hypothetical protein
MQPHTVIVETFSCSQFIKLDKFQSLVPLSDQFKIIIFNVQ